MKLDRAKFWKLYHKGFDAYGPTTQATVDALNVILDKFDVETRLKNIPQFSYCLATWYHETGINGNHFVPVREKKAGYGTEVWIKYQSKYWSTGFFGRGLDQTTFRENYLKAGQALGLGDAFVKNPDLLLDIHYAYDSAVLGMISGRYRADKNKQRYSLPRFFKNNDATLQEYFLARDIINGDKNRVVHGKKNGILIAETAEKFENILRLSQVLGASTTTADMTATDSNSPIDELQDTSPPTNNEVPTQIAEQIINTGDTAPPDPPAEGGGANDPPVQVSQGGFKSIIATIVGSIGGGATALWGAFTSNAGIMIVGIICVTVLLLALIFRQVLMDWLRMKLHADPKQGNVK